MGGSGALESHIMAGGRLEFGDRGEEVRDLQELLGFNRPDGVFGPMTMRQLTLAQGALGMTESGVVDLTTYAQLSDFIRSGRDIRAILRSVRQGCVCGYRSSGRTRSRTADVREDGEV